MPPSNQHPLPTRLRLAPPRPTQCSCGRERVPEKSAEELPSQPRGPWERVHHCFKALSFGVVCNMAKGNYIRLENLSVEDGSTSSGVLSQDWLLSIVQAHIMLSVIIETISKGCEDRMR